MAVNQAPAECPAAVMPDRRQTVTRATQSAAGYVAVRGFSNIEIAYMSKENLKVAKAGDMTMQL